MHVVLTAAWLAVAAGSSALGWPTSTSERHALPNPVVSVAWVEDGRLLLVEPRAVRLWEVSGGRAQEVAHVDLPGPFVPVREPAGLVLASEGRDAWILTNTMTRAVLVSVEDEQLALRAAADAIPWPGLPAGLRYREGTNIIEGALPEGSPQSLLALAPGRADLGVSTRGEWLALTPQGVRAFEGVRVGPTLAPIADDRLIASLASPPEEQDALIELRRAGDGWVAERRTTTPGAVRALATRVAAGRLRVACVIETPGASRDSLIVFELDVALAPGREALP